MTAGGPIDPTPADRAPAGPTPAGPTPADRAPAGSAPGAAEVPWQRLDARMIAVDLTRLAASLVPLGIAVLLRNADAAAVVSTLRTLALIAAGGAVLDLLRWTTTWYRVTDARVEVRSGIVTRRHRSMPRDRIRRVDTTAKVLHRAFGLSVVTLATGEHARSSDDELKLDAVTTRDAIRLRRRLLGTGGTPGAAPGPATTTGVPEVAGAGRSLGAAPGPVTTTGEPEVAGAGRSPGAADVDVDGDEDDGDVLASLDWRWAPYEVLSFWTLALPALLLGGILQALQSIGVPLHEVVEDDRVTGLFRDVSLAAGIGLGVLAIALVGVVGALALFVEKWWGFRLVREPGGRLRVRRGLLTSRSISLDEARLRGVEVAQPLLLRAARGARLRAVTTGLAGADSSRGEGADVLTPPAPDEDVQRIAAAVLTESRSPTDRPDLRAHPPGARRRRLTRAAVASVVAWASVGAAFLAVDGVPGAAVLVPAVVTIAVLAYSLDAYRNLGHAVTGRYLVVRRGSLARRTVALQRTGVIGWTVRRTVFQRRLGLATIVATTAAGRGAYPLTDVDLGDGLRIADRAVPALLGPFLADQGPAPDDHPVMPDGGPATAAATTASSHRRRS